MKKFLTGLFITLLAAGFSSCKKDELKPTQHDISSVTGPYTGNTGNAITLTVRYPYNGGCDYIGSFDEKREGSIVTIYAYKKPVSKETICTMELGFRNVDYNFTSDIAGTFELRFMKTDGSSVNHTVTIQ